MTNSAHLRFSRYPYSDVIKDLVKRISEAVETEPVMIAPVCPPAGVTVAAAVERIKSSLPLNKNEVVLVYNPTGTLEPAYVAAHKIKKTAIPFAVATSCMEEKFCRGGYICYLVPSIDYKEHRVKAVESSPTVQYIQWLQRVTYDELMQ